MKSPGKVFLVGGGPGDPGLLTVRGARLLKSADVVVVDALVDPSLFRSLKSRVIYVGKRGPGSSGGHSREMSQEAINQLLVRLAKQGKRVVRLKGGDPFIFGRGGEELAALRRARIAVEVVPGVSSVTGVPTFAGIPLTHRGVASQVTILTGQSGEDRSSGVNWDSLSPRQTLAVLMGVGRWSEIRRRLLAKGWPASKPVAAIEWGTTHRERLLESNLGSSSRHFKKHKLSSPSIIVVGDVVRLRKRFFGSGRKPLEGRRIAVTRPADQSAAVMKMLEKEGAETIVCPSIQIQKFSRNPKLSRLSKDLRSGRARYDWLVFLSANAVKTFDGSLKKSAGLKTARVLAVGTETKRVAEALGWKVNRMPKQFNSRGAVAALGNVEGKRILMPRAQGAPRDPLVSLRRRGAAVDELVVYRTVPARLTPQMKDNLFAGTDAISFTSSSTVKSFVKSLSKIERRMFFGRTAVFSIGPQTSAALKRLGVRSIREARVSTTAGLVKTMADHFGSRS